MPAKTKTPCCCGCCIKTIFSLGISALVYWLIFGRPSKPTLSIEYLYIPALNTTSNTTTNTTLFYHLKLKNNNKQIGVRYDILHLSFHRIQSLASPVVNTSVPGFYQGHKKKADRKESVEAVGVDWDEEVSNGTAVIRVDLKTAVRYKIVFWNTKRRRITVGGNLSVDSGGTLVKNNKKGIKLSAATLQAGYSPLWLIGLVMVLVCF